MKLLILRQVARTVNVKIKRVEILLNICDVFTRTGHTKHRTKDKGLPGKVLMSILNQLE